MNKKLALFLLLISFIFGYAVYQAMKLDKKLSAAQDFNITGTIIKNIPKGLKFQDYKNSTSVNLEEITAQGSNLLIHFWATWCSPCEVEFPELVEMIKLLKGNTSLKIVFVAIDDSPVKVEKFIKKIGLNAIKDQIQSGQVLLLKDDIKDYRRFGTYKLPETFLVGKDNKIIKKYTGGQPWTQQYLVNYLKSL